MLKQFHFIKNSENGFFLPFVLVISLVIILLITTFIKMYESEIVMTKNLINQLEVDTIVQMSLEQFKQVIDELDHIEGELTYTYPKQYEANIRYMFLDDEDVKLSYKIKLSNEDLYDVTQFYSLRNMNAIDE